MNANTVLGLLMAVAIGYAALAMSGFFDGSIEKAAGEGRKCGHSRRMNMMGEAERYCARALDMLRAETHVPALVLARVHTEVAALALDQKRVPDSVRHCEIALGAWQQVESEEHRREREQSTRACDNVIAAAKTRTP